MLLSHSRGLQMCSILDLIMETWEVTKLTFWFRENYFYMEYEDYRKVMIPYSQVSSLEFEKPFEKDGYVYNGVLLVTTKAQYAFMMRGLKNEFQHSSDDIESDKVMDDRFNLEFNIFDNKFTFDHEEKLVLDITDMGGICL